MKRYEKYKDSGVEWIGEIPDGWDIKKLKYNSILIMGQSPESSDCNQKREGIPFLQGNAEFGEIFPEEENWCYNPKKIALKNDVLVSVRAPIGSINIANKEYGIGRGLCVIRDNEFKFNYYLFIVLSQELNSLGTGSTFKAISTEQIENIFIPIPGLSEQTAIANYLDRKTAEIDMLISQKKHLLKLYEEEKTATINQAVTKGIDPNVKLKDSGVDWFGDIPEHWEIKKLKYLISKVGSGATPKGGANVYQLTGIPLLRSQNVHFGELRLDDVAYITKETHYDMSNSKIFNGDVLLNITGGSIGRCCYVTSHLGEANVNQHVCIIRPIYKILTKFLYFVLRSNVGQGQINFEQTGSGREGLNFEVLKNFYIPLPTLEEQTTLISCIKAETVRVDTKIAKTKKLIELQKEYRAALISEVITGKIKVTSEMSL